LNLFVVSEKVGNATEILKPARDDPETYQLNLAARAKIEITEQRGELHEDNH